jgi:hypothetical protein
MTAPDAAAATGQRIDDLLAELRARPDPRAAAVAEELTCSLVQLYGAGLERIAALLGPAQVADLCADPLVASLLLVHDLHPVDMATRIRLALERSGRPSGDVEEVSVDEAGVVRLRLAPSASGCGAHQIEALARQAAPDAADVIVLTAPALLQVTLRPGLGRR